MASKRKGKACRYCLGVFFPCALLTGFAFLGLGVALYLKAPDVIKSQVNKRVTVQKGHATYEQLEKPSIAIYKDFYFFNFTNAVKFAESKGAIKPELEEIGPYSYSEIRVKEFTDDSTNPDQIGYTQSRTFHFNSTTSKPGLAETDRICTINIPMVAAIAEAKDSLGMRMAVRALFEIIRPHLYTCQEATKLAWNYTDTLIKALHLVGKYPSKYVNIQVNDSIEDKKLSIIHTGVDDITNIGKFVQWNGLEQLTIWLDGANDINGTEGLFFRPNLNPGDGLTAFISDLDRSIDLVYKEQVKALGLTGYRYNIDNRTFKGAFSEPENARWCSWNPDGMIYLGVTQPKVIPVFGSKPHFLDADPLLLESVVGLEPNRSKHDTVIDVEPITGANINFNQRLQINVQVNRTEKLPTLEFPLHETDAIQGYNNSGVLYFPVLYINEHAIMDENFKNYLEQKGLRQVQMFETAVPAIFGVMVFAGAVFLLVSLLACAGFISRSRKASDGARTPLLNPSS